MTPQQAEDIFNSGMPVIVRRGRDEYEYDAITALIQRKREGRTELFVELSDSSKNSVTVAPIRDVCLKE